MSRFKKSGLAVMAVLIVCVAALPVSYAQSKSLPYVLQMNSNKSGAYLGIEMDDVTSANMSKYKLSGEKGVIVRSVQTGSPASDANLREDDVILDYAGDKVWSASQFSRLVEETPPGRKVELGVSRDGKRITLTAQIGSRDSRRSDYRWEAPEDLGRIFRDLPQLRLAPENRGNSADETARKPRLGVTLQSLTDQLGESLGVPGKKGALVSSVLEGSPSAGKLKALDVIIHADSSEIREPADLTRLVRDKSQGNITLKVIRDKKEITVVVNLPSVPASEGGSKGGIKL
jgi:serine protease Do